MPLFDIMFYRVQIDYIDLQYSQIKLWTYLWQKVSLFDRSNCKQYLHLSLSYYIWQPIIIILLSFKY